MRIQAEEFGQHRIAAMSQLHRFQTSEQSTLLFVEQAVEEQNGGFPFIGRHLENGSIGHQRNRLHGLPGAKLIPRLATIGGGVEETPGDLGAAQTSGAHEMVKRILDLDMDVSANSSANRPRVD